jgi:lipoprotein-anchoring transpeptidase ErfK/SrfK
MILYESVSVKEGALMYRIVVVAGLSVMMSAPAVGQTWAPWYQRSLLETSRPSTPSAQPKAKKGRPGSAAPAGLTPPGSIFSEGDDDDERTSNPSAPQVLDGGPRPTIDPQAPTEVRYTSGQPAGTIVVDTAARRLYLVRGPSTAFAYPVSVGREGFTWTGTEKISRMANWPDWHPPVEMRERDPRLPVKMTGGVRNPLGAKALYLGNTLYRIHGTSDARSIGRASSSGCFRMHNRHVIDLASRVGVGTKVVVVNGSTRTARN